MSSTTATNPPGPTGSDRNRSISQSRSISQCDFDDITNEELLKRVTELKQQVMILSIENEILENTLMRLDPALLYGIQQALEYANRIRTSQTSAIQLGSSGKSSTKFLSESLVSPSRMMQQLSSPSRISTSRSIRRVDSSGRFSTSVMGAGAGGAKINVVERTELVSLEMESLVAILDEFRTKAAKRHAFLKAQLEEVGIRVADVEKSVQAFNLEVIVEGFDKIAQRIPAEMWVRYMTEWVKICDSKIGKLRLRTSTLSTQSIKLKGQIKVKAELSESLRPVDFEKLTIENQECCDIIENKMGQLSDLKKITGDANLNLTIHKKSMVEQNNYLAALENNLNKKRRVTKSILKETEVTTVQADILAGQLDDVRKVRLTYEIPNVMEYVRVKAALSDEKNAVKRLETRLHVQQIALKSLNRQINSMFFSAFSLRSR